MHQSKLAFGTFLPCTEIGIFNISPVQSKRCLQTCTSVGTQAMLRRPAHQLWLHQAQLQGKQSTGLVMVLDNN